MSKLRGFSIVLHNLKIGSKPYILDHFKDSKWNVIAEERYPERPDGPDCHIHVFVEFPNPKSFKKMLKEMEHLSSIHQYPTPQAEGSWGRVQVDRRKGDKKECLLYLQGASKDKPLDPSVAILSGGAYKCYYCKSSGHGINFTITHPTYEGVCDRCFQIQKEYPGYFEYCPDTGRCTYVYDLEEEYLRPRLFSQFIIPP